MAKRLNKNLVVALTLAGMLLTTAAGIVLVRNLPQKSPKQFVDQGEEYEKKGEYLQASVYFQRAAQRAKQGDDRAGSNLYLIKAGDLALSGGDAGMALKLWSAVLVADPNQVAAQEKIVRFSLEVAQLSSSGDWWSRTQAEAEKLVAAADKAKTRNYVGLHALGRSLVARKSLREGNLQEGKKYLVEAFNGDKSNPEYANSLASSYLLDAQAEKAPDAVKRLVKDAAAVFDTAVQNIPKDPDTQAKTYLYRGRFYSTAPAIEVFPDAEKRALADLEKAVQLAPQNEEAVAGLGEFWHRKKLMAAAKASPPKEIDEYREKARDAYKKAIQADPDHYTGYLKLAMLLMEDKKYDDALEVLDQRIQRPINRKHYLGWRNRQYMSNVREIAFRACLAKYAEVTTGVRTPEESKTKGDPILDRLDQIYKATKAESGEKDPQVLFMQGRLLFLKNDPHVAIKALEDAEKLTPGDTPEIQRLLAILYLKIGSPGLAESALKSVLNTVPDDASTLVLQAKIKNELNKPEEAHYAADKVLAQDPHNRDALQAKGQAYNLQRNYEGVIEINKILGKGAGEGKEMLSLAVITQQQAVAGAKIDEAKLAEAVALYRQVLKDNPTSSTAYSRLAQILGRKPDQLPEARKVLAEARAALEKKLNEVSQTQPAGTPTQNLRRELINIDLMDITLDPALSAEDRLKRKEEAVRREKDPYVVAISLFQLYRDTPDKRQDAVRYAKEAYRSKPDDAMAIETLLQVAIEQKDWTLAEEVTNKAVASGIEKSGGHMYRGQILLARAQQDAKYLPDAERELRAAVAELPDFAEGHAQLGRALLALQRRADARAEFEKAMELNPQNRYAPLGLAIIAAADGREEDRQRYLNIASRLTPDNAWVQQQLQADEEQRDPRKGITRREERRKKAPEDVENLAQLADLYTRIENFDEAAKAYQQALKLAPTNLPLVTVYARFLVAKNPPDVVAARSLLQKAIEGVNANEPDRKAQAQLVYAGFLGALFERGGNDAPSLAELDQAYLAAVETTPSFGVLHEVGGYFFKTNRPAEAVKWYRQAVGNADAAGQKDQGKAARQYLIDALLRSIKPETYAETRKETEAYRTLFPDDLTGIMFTAELQAATGHDPEAIKAYTEFINRASDNPLGYVKRGVAYFRRSDWPSAIKDFNEVKQRAPGYLNGQPRLLLAQALEHNKQPDEALKELQSLSDAYPDYAAASQRLFELYLKLQRYDGAESLVNARSRQNPDAPLWDNLRRSIAYERKDYESALRFARQAAEKGKFAQSLVDSYMTLLLQLKRFDELIAFAGQKLPPANHNELVMLREASAYAGKGDVRKAIELYDKVVSTPPVDPVVLTDMIRQDPNLRSQEAVVTKELETRYGKDPTTRNGQLMLGSYRRLLGDHAAASKALRGLLATTTEETPEKRTEKVHLLRALATIHYDAKQWNESRDMYRAVLEKDPGDAVALNNLSYLLIDQFNQPQEALDYSRRVNGIVPDGSPQKSGVLDTLGWNLVLLGQYDEGIAQLGRSLELNTSVASVHYHFAEGLYRRSQKPGAASAAVDLADAKKEVRTACDLLAAAKADPEGVLDKITALAGKLGVKLPMVSLAGK